LVKAIFRRLCEARLCAYAVLLLFIVAAGLPMAAVTSVRNRLLNRVATLKMAAAGDMKPVSLAVGEYQEPFPAEFEKPAAPPLNVTGKVYSMISGAHIATQAASSARTGGTILKAKVPAPGSSEDSEPVRKITLEGPPADDTELEYQTGDLEQEAYQLLLQANPVIAGMIQGGNPALRFKSWGAAARGDDTYWVRVKFQSSGSPDVEYIWQVKLEAKQVRPLNFNARTLS